MPPLLSIGRGFHVDVRACDARPPSGARIPLGVQDWSAASIPRYFLAITLANQQILEDMKHV